MAAVEAAGVGENPGAKRLSLKESQEENGTASHLSEECGASFAGAEPNRQTAPASKLKKTAFKFFGGKRSICTLPSFFGGKNKSQPKGASKKGLSKSKTHDGISDVAHEEAASGCLRSPSDGGPDSPPRQLLPSSQSAVLGADLRVGFARPANFLSGSAEGFEKKPTGEKSLFLPRSRKGLKGLFNSIRRHRKSKVAEPEKTELQEWALRDTVTEEQPPGNGPGGRLQRGTATPEGGENVSGDAGPPRTASRNEVGGMDGPASSPIRSVVEAAGGPACPEAPRDGQPNLPEVCGDSAYGDLPEVFEPEFLENSPPCPPSGEQLSLMFGEVTSLKSFDSFTGCGDIIAEPDIDSIAESSTSAERSREAAKRTSCLVTYQGGGEEMALPEDLEEYLQQMWAGALKGDAGSEGHLPELLTQCDLQGAKEAEQEVQLYPEGTRNDPELLTPHSDQQESAPNSDEGYYDSTTPGPEDEGLDEIKKDRLPRDSYSGDALYEFYEPDDALMSPSRGEGSWFDGKVSPSKIFDHFLDFALPDEKDLIWLMDQKSEGMEEQRLATLQKQLLFWETHGDPALKHLQELRRDQQLGPGQLSECKMQATGSVGESLSCLGCDQMNLCALDKALGGGKKLAENQDRKEDFHKTLCPEKLCGGSRSSSSSATTKANSSCLIQPSEENNSDPDSNGEPPVFDPLASGNSVSRPLYGAHGHPGCSPRADFQEPCREGSDEPEEAVNFSQALVEFTSNGTLFSSLSESLRSSDSGSEFTQNFPDLPTMVTFDIVDVDQEGEGECEEHLEMNTDEDLAASFEAFRDAYDSKVSFAECDERMFPEYPQLSSQWGAASLPRRLRLQEPSPPLLEPLSVCRRSRSLDTESLEFELASLQLSKEGFRLSEPRSGSQKDPGPLGLGSGQEGVSHSPGEREEGAGGFLWPGRLNAPHGKGDFSFQETKAGEAGSNTLPAPDPGGISEQSGTAPPWPGLGQNLTEEPDGSNHPVLPSLRPLLTRPSTLFLQAPVMPPVGPTPQRPGGGKLAKKQAWLLPLGEKGRDLPLAFDFPPSPDKSSTCKPGDAARGTAELQAE